MTEILLNANSTLSLSLAAKAAIQKRRVKNGNNGRSKKTVTFEGGGFE